MAPVRMLRRLGLRACDAGEGHLSRAVAPSRKPPFPQRRGVGGDADVPPGAPLHRAHDLLRHHTRRNGPKIQFSFVIQAETRGIDALPAKPSRRQEESLAGPIAYAPWLGDLAPTARPVEHGFELGHRKTSRPEKPRPSHNGKLIDRYARVNQAARLALEVHRRAAKARLANNGGDSLPSHFLSS